MNHLTVVFDRIHGDGLKLSPKKCHLFRNKVRYVGHIMSADGIEPDPDKVDKVRNWPTPIGVDSTRTFLGFSGHNRRFVKDYAKIALPSNEILQDIRGNGMSKQRRPVINDTNSKFTWDEQEQQQQQQQQQQQTFDTLKERLTVPPILTYPDYGKTFALHTDDSMNGLGAVLYHEVDGHDRVISYASRGLYVAERNYPVHKL